MSWRDRRRFLATAAAFAAAGCGFRPVHGDDPAATRLAGRVRVDGVPGRTGHYLTNRLRRRLGPPGEDADLALGIELRIEKRSVVLGAQDEILRYDIVLTADYELRRRGSPDLLVANSIEVVSSVDATASAYAAYTAERSRVRMAAGEAADRILRDLDLRLALHSG